MTRRRLMLASLIACARKEALLIARDREGLAILFVMPVMFVLIMSLALHDFFRQDAEARFELVVLDGDRDRLGRDLGSALAALSFFRTDVRPITAWPGAVDALRAELRARRGGFAVVIPPDTTRRYTQVVSAATTAGAAPGMALPRVPIEYFADPTVRSDHRALAAMAIGRVAAGVELRELVRRFGGTELPNTKEAGKDGAGALLAVVDTTGGANAGKDQPIRATATQQNVPAYVLLAMFMLVVPLSGTFIKERTQGSLNRLRSMPVHPAAIIGGKIIPYLAINLAQVALCLAIGRWVLPLFGTEALQFGHSWSGIVALSMAASIAAIGFALAVASFARTPEQATAFGATAVLIFAALGGVMVPTVMMPQPMASLGAWSPVRWALDGFLELFVRDATLADIAPRVSALAAFGIACLMIAAWQFNRMTRS